MLYIKIDASGAVVDFSEKRNDIGMMPSDWWNQPDGPNPEGGWLNRNDVESFELAERLAEGVSTLTGEKYLPTDAGEWTSPRYDVIKAPKIGDEVSKGFNGDYYYMGKIVAIRGDYARIVVDGERGRHIFYRRKLTGTWLLKQMWSLVPGKRDEWNPEF